MDNNIDILENELLLSQIVGELTLKRKLLEETRQALSESQTARQDLEQELETQRHRAIELRTKLDLALVTLRRCEQDAAGATDKDARLECAIRERDIFKERMRTLQQHNDEMKNQVEELGNRLSSNEIMKRGLLDQMEKFQQQMTTVNEYIKSHETVENNLKKDVKASKTMMSILQSTINYYKGLNEKSITERQLYLNEISKLTAHVQTLKMQNQSTVQSCAKENEENLDLQKTIAHLKEALEKENETVTRLTIQTEQQNSKKSLLE